MNKTVAALELVELSKRYGNGVMAVENLSLRIEQGDFFALLGSNGAGKSTTIGILTSLVRKTSGKVFVFGRDIDTQFSQAKQLIGLVPQEFNFNVFETCLNALRQQAGFYNLPYKKANENAEKYLRLLGLWEKRNQQIRTLSGGMKRRLMIARAMVNEPKLLILDEPTAGVDLEIRRSIWQFLQEINQQGTTIILTTHYLEEAENLCRNIAIIHGGKKLHQSSIKTLLEELDQQTYLLDIPAQVVKPELFHGVELKQLDDRLLEVTIKKQQGLNSLFEQLNSQKITVLSLRNKVNRLEALFLSLVK